MNAVTRLCCLTKVSVSTSMRRTVIAVSTSMLGMLALAAPASAFTETFGYSGGPQTWTVPRGITEATFDLYGASGGGFHGDPVTGPSLGGRAMATIAVTTGTSIQVTVGGSPPFTNYNQFPGFNGGGAGGFVDYAGGGATDIRIGGTALTNRALVAGGGGGSANLVCDSTPERGGNGGGVLGLAGDNGCQGGAGGGGGTQTAGGASTVQAGQFGLGGSASSGNQSGGGGGGGWYGGGAGVNGAGGGGGSGYGPPGTLFGTAGQPGAGLATITYTPTIATLIGSVVDLNLPPSVEPVLLKPLANAQQGLNAGTPIRACNQLAVFINRVNAQSGKGIPTADAERLTAMSGDVRMSLNCGGALSCAGQRATIAGTSGPDKLRGTPGDDVIAAKGGDDSVRGLRGDDIVCAGAGADLVRGQGGDDTLKGGSGKDELRGGAGSNRCRGGGSDSQHHC